MVVTIIVFVLVFGVVVIAHELGHFLIAKLNGIKVVQFSIGMGPDIVKFTKGETKYVLKLLPIGGACMFEGEDGIYTKDQDGDGQKPEGAFNIILAFLLSLIVVGFSGESIPMINALTEGYPAEEAGLREGDVITKIDGERIYLQGEVTIASALSGGEPMEIEYERDGQKYSTVITPKFSEQDNRYYLGFAIGETVQCKGFDLIRYSAYEVRYWLKVTVKSLLMLVQGKLSANDLSGPVGIAAMIDETIEVTKPYGLPTVVINMINFAVLLSVNLGVMNLLPLPALDGGRLLFMFIEVVRGRPVSPDKEGMVHFIGFVALMILMVFVLYNDIARFFVK